MRKLGADWIQEWLLPLGAESFVFQFATQKNISIEIYRTINLLVICLDVELGRSPWERNVGTECWRIGCWGRCLGMRGTRLGGSGENYLKRRVMICTVYRILFGWWNQEKLDGAGHVARREERREARRFLVEKPEEKIPIWKPKSGQ